MSIICSTVAVLIGTFVEAYNFLSGNLIGLGILIYWTTIISFKILEEEYYNNKIKETADEEFGPKILKKMEKKE